MSNSSTSAGTQQTPSYNTVKGSQMTGRRHSMDSVEGPKKYSLKMPLDKQGRNVNRMPLPNELKRFSVGNVTNVSPEVVAYYFECVPVGKRIKKSKRKYSWELSVNNERLNLQLFHSKISGKIRLNYNEKRNMQFRKRNFPYSIDSGGHKLVIHFTGDCFELQIDKLDFPIYLKGRRDLRETNRDEAIKAIQAEYPSGDRLYELHQAEAKKVKEVKAAKKKEREEAKVDAKPKTAENTDDAKPKTAENTDDAKPETAENTDDVKPETAENTDDAKPETAENTDDAKPETAENTDDAKPETAENTDDAKPETAENTDDAKPETAENTDDAKPETAENTDDVKPETAENDEEEVKATKGGKKGKSSETGKKIKFSSKKKSKTSVAEEAE